jgi:hypothetical protein
MVLVSAQLPHVSKDGNISKTKIAIPHKLDGFISKLGDFWVGDVSKPRAYAVGFGDHPLIEQV